LRGLSNPYTYLGQFEKGIQIGEKILSLAERRDDSYMRVDGYLVLGYNLAFHKDLRLGLDYIEKRLLSKAYESFTEGFTTADMIVAKNLLR